MNNGGEQAAGSAHAGVELSMWNSKTLVGDRQIILFFDNQPRSVVKKLTGINFWAAVLWSRPAHGSYKTIIRLFCRRWLGVLLIVTDLNVMNNYYCSNDNRNNI